MDNPTCADCRYFRRHYVKTEEGRFQPVNCGHCFHPRLKKRKPGDKACEHRKDKTPP